MAIDIDLYGRQFVEDYNNQDFEVTLTRYRKKKMIEILKNYNTENMLEIGCGMEPFFLDYQSFKTMTVVEPVHVLYESAVRYKENVHREIYCINGFFENSIKELPDVKYDFILLVGLIHEVENPVKLIETVRSVCNNYTNVLITTNNPNSFHLTLAYESGMIPELGLLTDKAKKFQRQRTYTMQQMREFVKDNGFSILEEGSYFVKPFSHKQMKALLDKGIIAPEVLDGLDKMIKYMPELGAENYCVVKLAEDKF